MLLPAAFPVPACRPVPCGPARAIVVSAPIVPEATREQNASPDPRLDGLTRLLAIVDRLRAPDGCPWDRAQTLESMAPQLLEEAYEVVDAIRDPDPRAVSGELGDLMMNVFLMARIGEDAETFSLRDVAETVADKLVRRHPHVFAGQEAGTEAEALRRWESIKQEEREESGQDVDRSALAGLPRETGKHTYSPLHLSGG